jgi:YHS domain-containing protein
MEYGMRPNVRKLLLVAALALSACRSTPMDASGGETLAECSVCRQEGDLACVRVHVDETTPRCECDGQIYYFCSDECRGDFQLHPERYTFR